MKALALTGMLAAIALAPAASNEQRAMSGQTAGGPSATPGMRDTRLPESGFAFVPGPAFELPPLPTPTPSPVMAAVAPPVPGVTAAAAVVDGRAEMVASFMSRWSGVLAPYAGEMVAAADGAGIDWRMLPAIAVMESGAGAQACGFNPFGYASCRERFGSWSEGIAVVASTLAGGPYAGLDMGTRLCVWQSGTRCATEASREYRDEVLWLMEEVGSR